MNVKKKTTEQLVQERPSPEELLDLPRTPLSVVVDNVRSLDNVGMIFRLCELARVDHLYLTGFTGHPRIPDDPREDGLIARHEHRIFKTAVYAASIQPWSYVEDPVALVQTLKEDGQNIIALEQTTNSVPYHKLPTTHYKLPTTLIVGHERQGVRQELVDLSDTVIEIPIRGLGNSHNVAVATGIIVYHILEKTEQL
jgi:tRNA G18 (ribose-2'-O)-methylase SpoU